MTARLPASDALTCCLARLSNEFILVIHSIPPLLLQGCPTDRTFVCADVDPLAARLRAAHRGFCNVFLIVVSVVFVPFIIFLLF
jgi:hypothetical protein